MHIKKTTNLYSPPYRGDDFSTYLYCLLIRQWMNLRERNAHSNPTKVSPASFTEWQYILSVNLTTAEFA